VAVYVPILKARGGEFMALDNAWPPVTAVIKPLLEVMQNTSGSLYGSVLDFGNQLVATAPKGMTFGCTTGSSSSANTKNTADVGSSTVLITGGG
jgi:hypothetical protein